MSPYCFYCFLVAPFYVRKRRRGEGFPNAQLVAKDFRSNKSAWSSSINNEGQTKVSVSVSVSAKKRVSVSVSVSAKNRVSVLAKILVSVHLYFILKNKERKISSIFPMVQFRDVPIPKLLPIPIPILSFLPIPILIPIPILVFWPIPIPIPILIPILSSVPHCLWNLTMLTCYCGSL